MGQSFILTWCLEFVERHTLTVCSTLEGALNISLTLVSSLTVLDPQHESQNFKVLHQSEAFKF